MHDHVRPLKLRTLAAQALGIIEPHTKAIVPPVHVATTYIRDADNQYRNGFVYGRSDNATVRQAEDVLAALEGAEEALLFASGMAAATSAVLALDPPAHIVVPTVMYWGWRKWLLQEAPRYGYQVDVVDMTDVAAIGRAVRPGHTKLVWTETPTNPTWDLVDIAAVAKIAHAAGAYLVVDSTVATPVITRPLALGADLVMHSATKYLNGHSDVVAGVLACAEPNPWWLRIREIRTEHGAILGPFEAWLLMRGMRTLDVRVRAQCEAAAFLATVSSSIPRSRRCSIPACRTMLVMRWRCGRWRAGLAVCFRSVSQAGRKPRSTRRRASICGNGRHRWEASKASWNTVPRSRATAHRARPICCAFQSALRIRRIYIGIWTRHCAEAIDRGRTASAIVAPYGIRVERPRLRRPGRVVLGRRRFSPRAADLL